ncbi:MAG: hypothetical protein PHQ54_01155 [Candidatus Omnitrophica bacterium]|nr:hypothetical protein [Candidatus Omnitrophota bacterium]
MKNNVLILLALIIFMPHSEAVYKKATQEAGLRVQLNIDELAAVNFLFKNLNPDAEMHGDPGKSLYTIFSGKNFNINGTESSGIKEAVKLNLSSSLLHSSHITLEGSPQTAGNFSYDLAIEDLTAVIKKNANISISGDTVYQNTAIGAEDNFQIVYVNNAKITLSHGFKGYGILYIEDSSYSSSYPIFEMLGSAKWHGLIIINQTANKTSKIYFKGSPAMNLENFAIIGIESVTIGSNLSVSSGAIGAYLDGGSVTVGDNASFSGSIIGDSITLGNNAQVTGNIYYNTQLTTGTGFVHSGDEVTPCTVPFSGLPEFPDFEAGADDISIDSNATYTLEPGSYRNISIGNNSTLIITGGTYNINNLSAGNSCLISYQNPADINVKGKVEFGNTPKIKPASESVNAKDFVLYIEGANYEEEDVFYYEDVFIAYNRPELYCNIYAPNSAVKIGNYGQYKGAVIAKHITSGNNPSTSVELNSAFTSPPAYIEVYGSIVLSGNTIHIPYLGSNCKIYFSHQALTKVNELLWSIPVSWRKWKEVE